MRRGTCCRVLVESCCVCDLPMLTKLARSSKSSAMALLLGRNPGRRKFHNFTLAAPSRGSNAVFIKIEADRALPIGAKSTRPRVAEPSQYITSRMPIAVELTHGNQRKLRLYCINKRRKGGRRAAMVRNFQDVYTS